MGEKTLNIRIKNKYDTEANWTKNNPVLLAGETAYSSDKSGKYKIGDGTHKWSELSYAKADLVKSDVTTALGYTPPTNNTWRGVQNNLTSTATDQSLSAAQGKILNELTFQKKKTIDATVDWDTLKEFGCYKIQMASWGDAATKHSPNAYGNVYQFGLLLVFRGYDADTENRTVQIYIPHHTDVKVSSVVLIRMLNGTGWQAWHPIARGTGWSDIINKPTTFTPSSHTHDDRYYTETEMNSKLVGYLPISGGTLTGNLNLKPASGEGGEIHLDASTANRTENGIILDQQGGNFRIFGVPSADGTTKTGSGTPLVINPYSKTITGGYTLTGALSGNASSATALTSSAGSATQPVYFSGGKPVACSYTLGKSVPADALFTDHTYGNMKGATSSAAGSAGLVPAPNIGEQLKFLRADGTWVIPTNTTYSVGTSSYLGITKLYTETGSATDGTMTQNAITTALNGKSPTSHTHNYAGSSSSGGAANSANKLATARTVSGGTDITLSFNYDGSGNSSANIGFYSSSASVGDKNNYPFHRFAKLDTIAASYSDKSTTFFISQDYSGGGFGIVRIVLRTNNSSLASTVEVKWLVRCGLSADSVQVGIYNVFGKTYADAFFKTGGSYAGTCFRTLASGARGGISRTWVLVNSSEVSGTSATDAKTSTECYATIAAAGTALHKQAYSSIVSGTDSGTASYANSAGSANSVAWGNVTGKPSTFAPSSHTHNYAGSSSAGGNANAAVKLANARKIGSASFDGTADITLSQMGLNVPVEITKADYLAKKKAGTLNANTYYNVIDEYDSANVINDSSVTANSAFSSTKSEKTYAKKSTLVTTTLTASKWTGSSAPYTYVLPVSGATTSNIVEINYASNASSQAIEAYQNAMLADGGQTTNQITIKATEKPTVDIPITIVIRNDL